MRLDVPGALIDVAPPSSAAIFATMAALFALLAALAAFGHAQIVAEGRGIVRPDQPPIVLRAPFAGTVQTVNLAAGALGNKGQVLIEMDVRTESIAFASCAEQARAEQKEVATLEQHLSGWSDAAGHSRDPSMALVVIAQLRAEREKAASLAQRCNTLGNVVDRSRVMFPSDATVADVAVVSGTQVREGDALATLTPAVAHLVGFLSVAETRRNEIAVGQNVKLKFDALPFDEVGAGTARISRVLESLPAGVKLEGTEGGGVFAELVVSTMPAGSGPPRSGMTFSGDVLTRRARILALLFGAGGGD
jgi:multidrug resistance efflux pump